MLEKNKVVWLHSFSPNYVSSGIFMHQQLPYFTKVDIHFLYVSKLFNIISFLKQFFRYKDEFKDSIIHAQYGSGIGLFTSFLNAKKKVLTLRGSDWYTIKFGTIKEKIHSRVVHMVTCFSLHKYDIIIVMSQHMKDEILYKYPELNSRIRVITDGVDLNKFKPEDKNIAKRLISAKIECDPEKKWILFSSIHKLNSIKRYYLAEKTFNLVKAADPNIEMHFMQGFSHEDVVNMVNASDVIFLTSQYEGWPNIVKEGLSCNVPFVSTEVSDLKKVSRNTGNCFVCSDDEQVLANKVMESLNRPYEILRDQALEFELGKNVRMLEDVYLEINNNS